MMPAYITSMSQATSLGDDLISFWNFLAAGQSGEQAVQAIDDIDFRSIPIEFCHTLRTSRLHLPKRGDRQFFLENKLLLDHLLSDLNTSQKIDGVIWGNSQVGMPEVPTNGTGAQAIGASEWQRTVQAGVQSAAGSTVPLSQIIGLAVTCNTGIAAIGMAAQRISVGQWRRAIVVIQENRCREQVLLPYYKLNLLSRSASKPFAADRDGFIKGEGGCAFLLESQAAAEESSADPYCRISGYSMRSQHEHVFEASRGSEEAAEVVRDAIDRSHLNATDIDYINLYGSGSLKNDELECQAIKSAFGKKSLSIPASGLKPYFGHLNHASSAIETAATALMLKKQQVVKNLELTNPDPKCDLNFSNFEKDTPLRHALKISFGFGWSTAALVLSQH